MLNKHIGSVPEQKRHGTSDLRGSGVSRVPCVPASIDPSGAVAIDMYPFSGDDEAGVVVLERYRIGIVSPILDIIRELPTMPVAKHFSFNNTHPS